MKNKKYQLFGFANGGGSSPQFLEPIFKKENKFFIQVCSDLLNPDLITNFNVFSENIEVLEDDNGEILSIGEKRLFAIREIGERIVCGDRDFLKKYLKYNIGKYNDKPYFFKNACDFSNLKRAELILFKTHHDLLETSVLTHSIDRFCTSEYSDLRFKIKDKKQIVNKPKYYQLFIHEYEMNKEESIFSRWLEFATKDSPKLAKSSKWKNLNSKYNIIFNNDKKSAKDNTIKFYWTAKSMIGDGSRDSMIYKIVNQKKDEIKEIHSIAGSSVHYISKTLNINSKMHEKITNKPTHEMITLIYDSLLNNKVKNNEVTMLVYFIDIAYKKFSKIIKDTLM